MVKRAVGHMKVARSLVSGSCGWPLGGMPGLLRLLFFSVDIETLAAGRASFRPGNIRRFFWAGNESIRG
jgi:hypothetical protein